MGKAIVFDDITVASPLQTVTFTHGVSGMVREYLDKLSIDVPEPHAEAFQAFYVALRNGGVWDKLTCLYPMYGSVSGCAYGLIGDSLTIPTGATYDKGINLVNATGGFGADGRGILLMDNFPSSYRTNYSLFVNYPYGWTSAQRGYPFVFASDAARTAATSAGRFLGQAYGSENGWLNIRATLASDNTSQLRCAVEAGTKGLFGETHTLVQNNDSHYLYHDGEAIASVIGGYDSVDNMGKLGVNASAQTSQVNHCLNVPINMVIVSNGYALSAEDVALLNTSVKALVEVIF